jgi:RHS repeat-associated protein
VENVFGPTGLAEQVDDASQTAQFAQADALGTIRLITDGAGNVVGTGSYSPWGTPESDSVTLNGFGFTGEQLDPETGFVYLRNRYYDPSTGRFLTPDPLGSLGSGINLYAYVGNNPIIGTDPSGYCFDPDAGGTGFCAGGGSGPGGDLGGSAGGEDIGGDEGGGGEPSSGSTAGPVQYPDDFIGPKLQMDTPLGEGERCPYTTGGEGDPTAQASNASDPQSSSSDNPGKASGKTVTRPGMGLGPQGSYPPGYDPDTWTSGPSSRPSWAKAGQQSWYDPEGGEWSYDAGDRPWHPEGPHWDYNPHDNPVSRWQNISVK